jgi:hypothetical protein
MLDDFANLATGLESPATHLQAVVPDDAADLPRAGRALNVAVSGNVRLTTVDGTTATIHIAAGIAFPVRAQRIWATGTTATGIVVLS